jgi:hypothetical protein
MVTVGRLSTRGHDEDSPPAILSLPSATDVAVLGDLARFARVERDSGDLEPWAAVLAELRRTALGAEEALWLVKLYNAYDDLGSAWTVFRRWPGPGVWAIDPDGAEAADLPLTNERRNLRGGKVIGHLSDYVAHLAGDRQRSWLMRSLGDDPEANFGRLTGRMRRVWGVGRQTAFEWAEFVAKVDGVPARAPDAMLWESEGPRRSLQRIFGNDRPSASWLDDRATEAKAYLAAEGVDLAWEDFETVICDFNVMRDGRYYPGRHLAALRAEIDAAPAGDRELLETAWAAVIPAPWCDIAPGIDKALLPVYRDTGKLVSAP